MTIRPSRARELLLTALALGAVRAIALCGPPPALLVAGAAAILAVALHAGLDARRPTTLRHLGGTRWRVEPAGRAPFEARLAPGGYRAAGLLVLALDEELPLRAGRRPRRRRVVVFGDAVGAEDFSRLQTRLAFADPAAEGP